MKSQKAVNDAGAADDLTRLIALADPQPGWLMLDVSLSDDLARAFTPLVGQVIKLDWQGTPAETVTGLSAGMDSLAEADLITCRLTARYLPDAFPFVMACARLLKPGGTLLIEDLTVPDDPRAARYIDSFERLRDPRHRRAYAPYEWEGLLLDAGLTVAHLETWTQSGVNLVAWAGEGGASASVLERLHVLLRQAPLAVRDWLRPFASATPDATFDQHYVVVKGKK
jgi:SAM-dependent methyltransferase